jgi:hypothetical protein
MKHSLIGVSVLTVALVLAPLVVAGHPSSKPSHSNHAKTHHHSHTHHHHMNHHHHTHHKPTTTYYAPARVVVTEAPVQYVRYLRVRNNSGGDLRVYARVGDDTVKVWNFAEGQTAYLAIGGSRLTASEVYLWATSEGKRWSANESEALTLVSSPYRSAGIGTFDYTFNP